MKQNFDLSTLKWSLSGWIPHVWRLFRAVETGDCNNAIVSVPAVVPGSVQESLKRASCLPDWNCGDNAKQCEWVENRHWIYEVKIPDEWFAQEQHYRLECDGLDYSGEVYLNAHKLGDFCGTHIPHNFDLNPAIQPNDNTLRIIFEVPPRWLGQFGYSSKMTAWKPRFNYTWDWQPRIVQLGIWDAIRIVASSGEDLRNLKCHADFNVDAVTGILNVSGGRGLSQSGLVKIALSCADTLVREETVSAIHFEHKGISWDDLKVEAWWPNLSGSQLLYSLNVTLMDENGKTHDSAMLRIGFRNIQWMPCDDAPEGADPWICVINGQATFLQGVNFPPLLGTFADSTEERYRQRLELYRDLGMNTLRINACGFLETETFYSICDELGLLVWQDFPMTSSGVENFAPIDDESICAMESIARSFIKRRHHHASLLLWCGGNELADKNQRPLNNGHPMIQAIENLAKSEDPSRKFVATSPSGPRYCALKEEFGKGLHWEVHGEWKATGSLEEWREYWKGDDALFRSEVGAPGAASVEIIEKYKGDLDVLPIAASNPHWSNPVPWWLEVEIFEKEEGCMPKSLSEYVDWSQSRQAEALAVAVQSAKSRWPRCGGVLLWCGHDSFPCPTNTSIIDFEGNPKPAALRLKEIFHTPTKNGQK